MFFKGSRYEKLDRYTVTTLDGRQVTATRLPLPASSVLLGYHSRREGQRLDHIASRYLNDATTFWRLCDANNAIVPGALAAAQLVAVPKKE
ncbi:MAG: hypothetical protein ABI759_28565 [Candidatus Solibacter sp.]